MFDSKDSVSTIARDQDQKLVDLSEWGRLLLLNKWKIAAFTFASVILATLVSFSLSPVYRATTSLMIQHQDKNVVSIEEIYGVEMQGQDYFNTQYEILKSRSIAEIVVDKLKLVERPEFNASLASKSWYSKIPDWRSWLGLSVPQPAMSAEEVQQLHRDSVINNFQKRVKIVPVRKTKVVKIEFESSNARLAARVSDAIAGAYINSYLDARLEMTSSAHSWMQAKMLELEESLRAAEDRLQNYRESENLIDIDGAMTLTQRELQGVSQSYIEARKKRSQSQSVLQQVKRIDGDGIEDYFDLPEVLNNPLIQRLKEQQSIAQSRVEELEKRYGPKHPRMIAAVSERDAYDSSINRQVRKIVEGIQTQYNADLMRESILEKQLEDSKVVAQQVSRKQFKLHALKRDVETKKELYETFFKRIQESTATEGIESVNARIVDPAVIPRSPIKPRKMMIILFVGVVAFLLSCGFVLLLDILNNTVRNIRDVEEKLNLPVLGVLPQIAKSAPRIKFGQASRAEAKRDYDILKLLGDQEFNRGYGEAVRAIRTSLSVSSLDLDSPRKVYMVTSTAPGEGKSSVSVALASAMSFMGKTIVVGADLRRPGLIHKFGIKPGTPGLANVLTGAITLKEAINSVGNLDVIVAGMIPPNPQELLGQGIKEVIDELSKEYDNIIVDCPPVQSVADAVLVSKYCDGLLYVVESGNVSTSIIRHAVGRLLQAGAPLQGVVLNKVPQKGVGAGNYEYYYEYQN